MSRVEHAIFTNMCMIYDNQGNLLVQDRRNPDWPGITFPGGHVEKGESFVQSVVREVKEETGLEIERPILCGIKQFQDRNDARYVVLLYKTNRFSGTLTASDEGDVFWIPRRKLADYKLAEDFEVMVRVFESDQLSEFYYEQSAGEWSWSLF